MGRDWIAVAKECGFDEAGELDVGTLTPREMVRDACAENKCGAFGKNWTCPPTCGDLAACEEKMKAHSRGILLQTTGHLAKRIDTKGYAETAKRHGENFQKFVREIRAEHPGCLCLGAGPCTTCAQCAYPEPCRFPEKRVYAMEGFGLFVSQVCRDNGMSYYYGDKTITYTACVLFD